ncbi:MAG: SagB/ThcOx family dehydrogenase [Acidiferrobacterales bacterium]
MDKSSQNQNTQAALHYHESTKHSEESLRANVHFLDWENKPLPYKIYRGVESVPLIRDPKALGNSTPTTLEAISMPVSKVSNENAGENIPDLATLSQVLFLSAGITKQKSYPGGTIYFRAYSNTGALYHIDLYLVTQDLPDLPAGVYQFGPHDFALHRLRTGDYRGFLVEASGAHPRIARAPLILVSVSTYWRNAWKYQARAYRHCFWDGGTLHANLLAIAAAKALQPNIVMGFSDSAVEALLGLDPAREGALTLVTLGHSNQAPPAAPPISRLKLETEPLSRSEVDYPPIRVMHAASSLVSGDEATAWRDNTLQPEPLPASGPMQLLRPSADSEMSQDSLASVIRRRGSTRAFDQARSISFEELSTVLDRATRGIPADFLAPLSTTLLDLYLIVNAVDDLVPGIYYYRRVDRALELLAAGDFRRESGRLGLSQQLPADAAVNVYCLCSLLPILKRFGNRGYRAAQLEGGITGGRMYLAAYAQHFGATGLTFFDDEVTEFFSPHAAGKEVLFLTAMGHPDLVRIGR